MFKPPPPPHEDIFAPFPPAGDQAPFLVLLLDWFCLSCAGKGGGGGGNELLEDVCNS